MNIQTLIYAIGLSIFYSLLALLIERILIVFGITRGRTLIVFLLAFIGNLIGILGRYEISFYLYELFVLFVGITAANRFDLIKTLDKGRWWWKAKE